MRISRFINFGLIAIALLLGMLMALASQVLGTLDHITESERTRHRSLLLANELLQSSEDLTRMARTYVTTGKPIYERHFFEILDIRNGKQSRPLDYSTTHWHLAGVNMASASALGDAIPLQELMRREGFSKGELDLLRQSQLNSDALVNLEKQAFAAMKGLYDDGYGNFTVLRAPDRDFAISLLFSERYKAEKASIMAPLKQFVQELDNRTQTTLADLQSRLQQQILLILAVLCIALLGVAAATLYMRRSILRPLDALSRQTSSIAQGSYTVRCDIHTHNELAKLGADFNIMAEAIECDISAREQVNEQLHQSELRLNEAQRLAKMGNWEVNLISGKLRASDEVFRIFEIDPNLFDGRYEDFLNVVHPDDRNAVAQAHNDSLTAHSPYEITYRLRMPDGRIKWVSEKCETLYDAQDKARSSSCVVQDITERKQMEQALAEKGYELSDFIEHAAVSMHWVGPDGIILWANQTELDFLGYTREEYIGHHIADFHVDQPVIQNILDRLSRVEVIQEHGTRLRSKDGSIKDVLIDSNVLWKDGKFVHTRCFTRDITARKQAEFELLHATEMLSQFKYTLDQTLDTVFMFREEDFRFIYVNAGAQQQVGYTGAELLEMTPLDIKPEFTLERFQQMVRPLIDGMQPSLSFQTIHRHKDGHDVAVEVFLQFVRNGMQRGRFIAIVRDITERIQAEIALRERLKKSVCLYAIRRGMGSKSLEEVCRIVLEQLVAAMQFPQITSVMIELDGGRFTSGKYSQDLT
ncbi:MAG: PAS domain S-box protein, partial [Pseudomonadota bacterium]